MLKTLDIMIGTTTVLLLFSMAVTVITQVLTSLSGRRGRHLKAGLASLLQQLGIPTRKAAEDLAKSVLKHPMIADGRWRLGTVIHRDEFTKLLLDLAGGQGAKTLEEDSAQALRDMLQSNGISDPAKTLKNVRAMALQLEASNPELGNHVRDGLALLHEASSDFVARVNSWFDQTIDRVSQRFAHYTHLITVGAALLVVVAVQLDIVAVVDRLSIDDQFRETLVKAAATGYANDTLKPSSAATAQPSNPQASNPQASNAQPVNTEAPNMQASGNQLSSDVVKPPAFTRPSNTRPSTAQASNAQVPAEAVKPPSSGPAAAPPTEAARPFIAATRSGLSEGEKSEKSKLDTQLYYDLLNTAGLITLPTDQNFFEHLKDKRKIPGMLISILLISLGAPFWYNILKDLLGLRSTLAKKDDSQRSERQTTQAKEDSGESSSPAGAGVPAPAWLRGERGDLAAVG